MSPVTVRLTVRTVSAKVSIIDIQGELGGRAEQALRTRTPGPRSQPPLSLSWIAAGWSI